MKCPFCGSVLKYDRWEWEEEMIDVYLECEKCGALVNISLEPERIIREILEKLGVKVKEE